MRPPPRILSEVNISLDTLNGVLLESFADIGVDIHGSAEIGMPHNLLNDFQGDVTSGLAGLFHEAGAETMS